MKKLFAVMILGMALFTGCGKEEVDVVETETKTVVEVNEHGMTDAQMLAAGYPVMEEILGKELYAEEIAYDNGGIYVDGRYFSYEYIDEYMYNSLANLD